MGETVKLSKKMAEKLGLVSFTKKMIDKVFEEAKHQSEYVMGLYKTVIQEDWDKIKQLEGYPTISKTVSKYIFGKAIEFDKINHPDVVAGGAWLNNGFSTSAKIFYQKGEKWAYLEDWVCDVSTANIVFHEKEKAICN